MRDKKATIPHKYYFYIIIYRAGRLLLKVPAVKEVSPLLFGMWRNGVMM
jgi:hypothetical protein